MSHQPNNDTVIHHISDISKNILHKLISKLYTNVFDFEMKCD